MLINHGRYATALELHTASNQTSAAPAGVVQSRDGAMNKYCVVDHHFRLKSSLIFPFFCYKNKCYQISYQSPCVIWAYIPIQNRNMPIAERLPSKSFKSVFSLFHRGNGVPVHNTVALGSG